MIVKRVINLNRLRHVPSEGFSWVDRKFLCAFAPILSHDAILLYFFLASVCDKNGLSFYGASSTSKHLHIEQACILQAREELLHHDLIAFAHPITQVLSLPAPKPRNGKPQSLMDIFRAMGNNKSS